MEDFTLTWTMLFSMISDNSKTLLLETGSKSKFSFLWLNMTCLMIQHSGGEGRDQSYQQRHQASEAPSHPQLRPQEAKGEHKKNI